MLARENRGGDTRLVVDASPLAAKVDAVRLAVGESIAINGTCLTVLEPEGGRLAFDVSAETLGRTTLGRLQEGSRVNLEAALRMGDPLGGHLVSGHVDGLATVLRVAADARSLRVLLEAPATLARYIASKGSVALDGVSLTVNEVEGRRFGVNLIPHTVEQTTFGELAAGRELNLEIDPVARYVERLVSAGGAPSPGPLLDP